MTPPDRLPITVAELDAFVERLINDYKLPPGDDTYDAIATMIMHLPHVCAVKEDEYFVHGVWKSMANLAAYSRLQEFRAKRDAAQAAKNDQPIQDQAVQS